ncbi:hypothetical protein EYF80_023671 [Liparis tanakae]|uniref:Uncharacterized protein n=1 Tax=Liparis tanakae TaxID=230148 RepID=A0A4Z2HMI9_9TELE|nr:hypothetical protein EYF80_023671 [Liparis tanakae]
MQAVVSWMERGLQRGNNLITFAARIGRLPRLYPASCNASTSTSHDMTLGKVAECVLPFKTRYRLHGLQIPLCTDGKTPWRLCHEERSSPFRSCRNRAPKGRCQVEEIHHCDRGGVRQPEERLTCFSVSVFVDDLFLFIITERLPADSTEFFLNGHD